MYDQCIINTPYLVFVLHHMNCKIQKNNYILFTYLKLLFIIFVLLVNKTSICNQIVNRLLNF